MAAMQYNSVSLIFGITVTFVIVQLIAGISVLFNVYTFFIGAAVILWLNWKNVVIIVKTFPRDICFTYKTLNALIRVKLIEKKNTSFINVFHENAKRNPHKICFYFEDEKWTFRDVDEFANQVANVFQTAGYRKGDVVALLMGNSAVYVCMWLGLAKIGVITALINTNLRQDSLIHCIRSGKVKSIIYSPEFNSALEELSEELKDLPKYQFGGVLLDGAEAFDVALKNASKLPPASKDSLGYRDRILYIYTSGTTGLPKAAVITNIKCFMLALASWHVLGFRENDVMYNSLPLYHTAGGILAIAATLLKGFPVVIRRKFSASQFWSDCIRYNCTIGIYIGEMCRYIVGQPERPEDKKHQIRLLLGNGMRPTVWREFLDRFNVPQICELYGSTEGNTNLINIDKTVGAVGFLPQFLPKRLLPIDLIRVDENGQPIRGPDGLCIRCKPGEPGTFVGTISTSNSSQEFAGYVGGDSENQKKILSNVFKQGDKAFWSGDLLVTDELGYIYFKDRLGDTFRWKGENVSTAEVEGLVSRATGNLDVTVYGVKVGSLEGRAGMATIVDPIGQLNLNQLALEVDKCLPPYARPLFIRITQQVELTGTFKLKKVDLQREGFNPNVVNDAIYFRQGSTFIPLTPEIYKNLIEDRIRV